MRITTLPRILASKVVPDADLDLRPYGVVAAFSWAPVGGSWPTETLDWGDGEPEQLCHVEHVWELGSSYDQQIMTVTGIGESRVFLTLTVTQGIVRGIQIKVNGVVVASWSSTVTSTKTFSPFVVKDGDVIVISANSGSTGGTTSWTTIETDGKVRVEKTFDLSGKWLALGLDMQGLAATVKIQGVEMPYSDYLKYFPIAPTELKIPGEWTPDQVRPVIKVYA